MRPGFRLLEADGTTAVLEVDDSVIADLDTTMLEAALGEIRRALSPYTVELTFDDLRHVTIARYTRQVSESATAAFGCGGCE